MASSQEVEVCSPEFFHSLLQTSRKPCVIRGLEIGSAPSLWTAKYLARQGGEVSVKAHVCPVEQMDFITRNFSYRTLPFCELVTRASQSIQSEYFISPYEKYYLRAVADNPRQDVADFGQQFPGLAKDVVLPLSLIGQNLERIFSSVLRVGSAGVQLWTHYDVMDNLLLQITGRKRVVLFSPKDALNLYLDGDKSIILDIDNVDATKFPLFSKAVRYECNLSPGDALFIPALWFHNVVSLDFSVAVNLFWRNLDDKYYDHKDTYGNRDPPQVQRAKQILDRAIKCLEELPSDYRDFYARCMVNRIQAKCFIT